jgi:ankyrin repeat protein
MLRRCLPATIRRALNDLPGSLDETYERILLSIGEERWEYAQRLFQFLAVSFRPLRVDELAEVLAMQFDTGGHPNYDVTLRPDDSEEAVLSTCSGLITIVNVNGSPMVQFSHFSVKEYLMSERLADAGKKLSRYHILPGSAHIILARASLSIILTLEDRVDKNDLRNFPLAVYAARHWVDHAQVENVSSHIEDAMDILFDFSKSHFATWVWIYDIDYPFRAILFADHPTPPEGTPLYYAALCGFRGIVERLVVTCPQDVNAKGGYYSTPVHAALAKGKLDIAQVLLEHHADVTAPNNDELTPLHWASRRGHRDCVELLLKHQKDLNIQDGEGQTPLKVASRYGHLNVVRLLLQSGAAVDFRGKSGFTPLMSASRYGYPDVVRLLLQGGAAVDARDKKGWTPLESASRYGHLDIVRLLLQAGAAVDSRDEKGWTPILAASQHGQLDIVRLLLGNGAAVDSRDAEDRTPLMSASQGGHLDIVHSLLQGGATVDSRDKDGWTPLMDASRRGYLDIVRLLLENGAVVDSCDRNDSTSLMLASRGGHLDIVRVLLENGAAIDSCNYDNSTPLAFASRYGHLDVVRLLLRSGAAVDVHDKTSLISGGASRFRCLDIVQPFLTMTQMYPHGMWTDQLHYILHLPTVIAMSLSCSSNTVQIAKNEMEVNKRRWTSHRTLGNSKLLVSFFNPARVQILRIARVGLHCTGQREMGISRW